VYVADTRSYENECLLIFRLMLWYTECCCLCNCWSTLLECTRYFEETNAVYWRFVTYRKTWTMLSFLVKFPAMWPFVR